MRNYFPVAVQVTKRNDNIPADDKNISANERVKQNGAQRGIEVPEIFQRGDGKIKRQQQREAVNGSANQPVLVILADKGIQLFNKQSIIVFHGSFSSKAKVINLTGMCSEYYVKISLDTSAESSENTQRQFVSGLGFQVKFANVQSLFFFQKIFNNQGRKT